MNKVLETTPDEDLHRVSVELARSMTKVRQFSSLVDFHFNHFLYEGLSLSIYKRIHKMDGPVD